MRLVDNYTLPSEGGNVIVLIVSHPGENHLARYFPPSRINDLLLPGKLPERVLISGEDTIMESADGFFDDYTTSFDIIDIASFLEYGYLCF